MNKVRLLGTVCAVLFSFITVSANATLHGRLPLTPGGTDYQAAYDTVLDITWVTNATLSGPNTWDGLVAWASNLDYLGFDDWRLASMSVSAGLPTGTSTEVVRCSLATELACRDNELDYMYTYNMGGTSGDGTNSDLSGNQTGDCVLLTDVQFTYWSGTAFPDDQVMHSAWAFNFLFGTHSGSNNKDAILYGWAVRDGDVQENSDADGDWVNDDEDLCPDTVIPEGVPTVRLGVNRWALVDGDSEFDTTAPNGKGPGRCFSTVDTGGCSCEQIIGALGLGTSQEKFGCSNGTMDGWVALPR